MAKNSFHDALMHANVHQINGLLLLVDERNTQQIHPTRVYDLMVCAAPLYRTVHRNIEFMEDILKQFEQHGRDDIGYTIQEHIGLCNLVKRKVIEGI